MFSLFKKINNLFLFFLTWIVYAVFHAVSMYFIVSVDIELLIIDAVVHSGIFASLGLLLLHILFYGKYETWLSVQRTINYVALGVLTISFWLGSGYLLNYLLLQESATLFIPTLPVRGVIGLLIYLIFILLYSLKTKQILQQNNDSDFSPEPDKSNSNYKTIDRITVKTGQKLHIIPIQDIMCLQADGDYVQLITKEGTHLKEQTMKYFELHLPKNIFVRIHRSYMVNIEYISRIESYGKQNQEIALKNGQYLKMSIAGYKLLKDALQL